MSTAHAALAEQARAIQAELDAARARERDLAERAAHTARELDRMASSRSWRITAPIRRLGGMMRPPGR